MDKTKELIEKWEGMGKRVSASELSKAIEGKVLVEKSELELVISILESQSIKTYLGCIFHAKWRLRKILNLIPAHKETK